MKKTPRGVVKRDDDGNAIVQGNLGQTGKTGHFRLLGDEFEKDRRWHCTNLTKLLQEFKGQEVVIAVYPVKDYKGDGAGQ